MARPSKATSVLESEGRSHRTKAELQQRREAESAAMTGLPLVESDQVRADEIAHAEFERMYRILAAVGKADALFESVVNDYCLLKSDVERYVKLRDSMQKDLEELSERPMDTDAKYKLKAEMYKNIVNCDKQIQALRKKRFDIEKENGMTIASSARNIPKSAPKKENPLREALGL